MKKLYKSNNRMICGVCAGLAEYLGIDPTVVRPVSYTHLSSVAGGAEAFGVSGVAAQAASENAHAAASIIARSFFINDLSFIIKCDLLLQTQKNDRSCIL